MDDDLLDSTKKEDLEQHGKKRECLFCYKNNPMVLEEHHVIPRRFTEIGHGYADYTTGDGSLAGKVITVCSNCHSILEYIYNIIFDFKHEHVDTPIIQADDDDDDDDDGPKSRIRKPKPIPDESENND